MHIGGWMQLDNVWWNQTDAMKVAKGANAGKSQGVASGDTLAASAEQQRRSPGRQRLPPHPRLCRGHLLGNRRVQAHSRLGKRSVRHERAGRILGRPQGHSPNQHRPHRTRQGPDGPGRRYDRFQPLHDLHGKVLLLGSDRTESELRHRPLGEQQLPRPARDLGGRGVSHRCGGGRRGPTTATARAACKARADLPAAV